MREINFDVFASSVEFCLGERPMFVFFPVQEVTSLSKHTTAPIKVYKAGMESNRKPVHHHKQWIDVVLPVVEKSILVYSNLNVTQKIENSSTEWCLITWPGFFPAFLLSFLFATSWMTHDTKSTIFPSHLTVGTKKKTKQKETWMLRLFVQQLVTSMLHVTFSLNGTPTLE